MNLGVYTIKDKKVGYLNPTFEQNDEVAARNFVHAVQTSGTILTSHREDFALYRLGMFDTQVGRFTLGDVPELVIDGGDVND